MSNNANQNQSNELKIYLRDLHQWVPVSKTDYDNYYRDINAYRRRQQEHGRCVCPANKRYLCDMDCWTCRFHKAGDELSLDYTVTDDDGNEKSWLDDLADDAPGAQSILEDKMSDMAMTIEELRRAAAAINEAASWLAEQFSSNEPTSEPTNVEPVLTLEAVRAVLANKSRAGITAQIRSLLQKYGADKLSGIDPANYKALLEDVEGLTDAS